MKPKLKFNEKKHEYKLGTKKLMSVTKFISQFFEPFDAKEVARTISAGFKARNYQKFTKGIEVTDLEKKKATMKYWLNDWKEAARHGTETHKFLEWYINDEEPEDISMLGENRSQLKRKQGITWFDKYIRHLTKPHTETEKIIYDEELGLAGTIDLVLHDGDNVELADWKTNKAIKPEHIEKYSLQLSLYRYMLERQGYDVTKLIIVHLMEDSYKEIEVEYMKDRIEDMLKCHGKLK